MQLPDLGGWLSGRHYDFIGVGRKSGKWLASLLLPVRFVGSFFTARCSQRDAGLHGTRPKSCAAAEFRFFRQTLGVCLLGLLAVISLGTATAGERVSLDNGWTFQLNDPPDVLTNSTETNVTYYPEISDLAKLDANEVGSGNNTETYMESIRIDPVASHVGESVSFVQTNYNDSGWQQMNVPHDWVVGLPFSSSADGGHGFKAGISGTTSSNTIAWYRHTFTLPSDAAGQALALEFDGVYRNCLVWLNGHILGRNVSGYDSFSFDITRYINAGGTNVLVVRVDASRFEGWFYEGGGIYRHVWLTTANLFHVAHWGTFVTTTALVGNNATLTLQTVVTNQSGLTITNGSVTSTIWDASSNAVAALTSAVTVAPGQDLIVTQSITLAAHGWSPSTPYLYQLVTTVSNQNAMADIYQTPFGVRTVSIDATNGVFINGQHVEIRGMCDHQDMAGVGSALPDRLQYFRLERLKEMGCNALRTSHNTPTPELLNACDQLGVLVLDENRRLGTNAEPMGELQRHVLRDRNHPAVFMWSLANEETLQATATGASVIQGMQTLVHSLDPTRLCTAALNSWGAGFSSVLDVNGFNYQLGQLDIYHASKPSEPIIGTETSSLVSDRGEYANDPVNGYVWGYDVQSSGVSWGEPAEVWWPYYDARPWSSGGFSWTGFDYRGEPTPYGWPCINSHFGTLDMCGFPKDNFYYYQANWTLKPVLHLFPHWNWGTAGQAINIWAFGNCQAVELFVNGTSQGLQTLDVQGHVEWDNVLFTPGTLQAIGYNNGIAVLTNTISTTGPAAAIALLPDRSTILADGRDVAVVTVEVLDAQGNVVPTASNNVTFAISGGTILGVGNGNPSSHEPDRASQRMVFNGLAEVIVQATNQPGFITLTATSTGLSSTTIFIGETASLSVPAVPTGVVAMAGSDGLVRVSWDVAPGAFTYKVKRATTIGGPYTVVAPNTGSSGFTDGTVSNFTTYYYQVSALNPAGESLNSAVVSVVTQFPPVPAAPDGLSAEAGDAQASLSWTASLEATSYNIKVSTSSGGPYTNLMNVTGTDFVVTGLADGTSYYFVVSALDISGESTNSTPVMATPVAFVAGLTASVVNSQVQLQWQPHIGATGYNVKRASVSGGPYTTMASSIVNTSYADTAVDICQTYYYIVTLTMGGQESVPSTELAVTVPYLTAPFTSRDIGQVGLAGNASACDGPFSITGSGADIWNNADAFQFVFVPMAGNGEISARVVSVEYTDSNAKAGVMIRETLNDSSKEALADVEPAAGNEFIYRTTTGGAAASSIANGLSAPYWVRLTRTNNIFRAFISPDGISWTQLGTPTTITMAATVYAGLAVCAHNNGLLCNSVFDNVYVSSIINDTPPAIAPIANRAVNVGQTVTLPATATDNNSTPQTLSFHLLSAPVSATLTQLNNTNAVFAWRPAVTDANRTNSIMVVVSDSGTPSLSATQSFTITVNPLTLPAIKSSGWNTGSFTLVVTNPMLGPDYAVQSASNLVNWNTLFITNSPATTWFQWTDTNAPKARTQFYRIKVGPPLP